MSGFRRGLFASRDRRAVARLLGPKLTKPDYIFHWSARHRYVYAEVPKAASTTIKVTLQRFELGDPDYILPNMHRRATSPLLSPQSGGFLAALTSPDFFRFAFVRDPVSRVLAAYLDKLGRADAERPMRMKALGLHADAELSFEEFLDILAGSDPAGFDVHWSRQTDLLQIGKIAYDFIGRFETFGADFACAAARLGIGTEFLSDVRPHSTGADARVADLGPRERRLIEKIYAADFDRFGYGIA